MLIADWNTILDDWLRLAYGITDAGNPNMNDGCSWA